MTKKNEKVSPELEKGELIAIEDIEIKWREILHMIIDMVWSEKGRVNDGKNNDV